MFGAFEFGEPMFGDAFAAVAAAAGGGAAYPIEEERGRGPIWTPRRRRTSHLTEAEDDEYLILRAMGLL